MVIRLSSLGDIILSFPLVNKLRGKFPDAEIHFLTKVEYIEILKLNPAIDKIITLKSSLKDSRKEISSNKYDLTLDIHKNFRSIYISSFNGKKVKRYRKDNFRKFLLVNFKIDLLKDAVPVYRKYLNTIGEYIIGEDHNFSVSQLNFDRSAKVTGKYIVIAPSSRHFTKTYPKEKFVNFINEFHNSVNAKFVLVGDNSERDKSICKYITEHCNDVTDLCGNLSINELAGVLHNSYNIITNDSAILHFSEALGKSVTAVFGSTVKQFGFFPQLIDSRVMEVKDLKCRPCTHIGRENCPEGHFKCMLENQLIVDN